jgi:ParB/RepB/Spo0J family partition protein
MAVAVKPSLEETPATAEQSIEMLALAAITPAPDNPRKQLGDVDELAASMHELGMLQPLIVTPRQGKFMVVCGHRRLAAANKAKLEHAPAIVRDLTEPQRIKAMLIENCQRTDLAALEEAQAYKQLVELGLSQRQIAADVGKSQGHISKRLMLLEIPKEAASALDSGGITVEDALELAKLRDEPKRQQHAWKQRGQIYGGIPRAVEQELENKLRDELIAAEEEKLKKKGLRIVKFTTPANRWEAPRLPRGLVEIRKGGGYDVLNIDPATHAKEPCHAVAVRVGRANRGQAELICICMDRKRHPNAKTGDERFRGSNDRESQQQKDARELSKARAPRREFAGTVARSRLAKDEHAALVLDTLISSAHSEVLKVACQMLLPDRPAGNGYRDFGDALRAYAKGSAAKQLHVELAIAFGTHEEFLSGPWNGWDQHKPYIELLERHGYELQPIEAKKIGRKAAAKKAA